MGLKTESEKMKIFTFLAATAVGAPGAQNGPIHSFAAGKDHFKLAAEACHDMVENSMQAFSYIHKGKKKTIQTGNKHKKQCSKISNQMTRQSRQCHQSCNLDPVRFKIGNFTSASKRDGQLKSIFEFYEKLVDCFLRKDSCYGGSKWNPEAFKDGIQSSK